MDGHERPLEGGVEAPTDVWMGQTVRDKKGPRRCSGCDMDGHTTLKSG